MTDKQLSRFIAKAEFVFEGFDGSSCMKTSWTSVFQRA